jgi:trk system potassium uptake protein TrkH
MYRSDHEWRFFTYLLLSAGLLIAVLNLSSGASVGIEPAMRDAFFHVTAIATTTGFVSTDYELWAPGLQMILFALFFVGGMAGSTGGGIKAMRVLLLLKQVTNELRKYLHPRAVLVTRIGKNPVKQEVLANVAGFVIVYLIFCLVGAILLAFMGMDLLSALGASIATLGNVGPGFGDVGPTENYGWLSSPALAVLSFFMLVGRLEIFTVLLLFHPEMWKNRHSFH